jgi:glycosyltransferase involved in cell wall biosynthesis
VHLTTPFSAIPEICGDAVLCVDPDNEKEFADTIVVLDKNDAVRKEMIIKGKKRVGRYSWAISASIFLEHLTRTHAR